MPRQVKRIKPLIYVFYEGESEQQYIDYLKSCFSDVAVIKRCSKRASTNLFADTKTILDKGIMPSEKVLDFPVDCNTLTGSVNL